MYYDKKEALSHADLSGSWIGGSPPLRPDRPISILNARNVDHISIFLIFKTPRVPCIYDKYVYLNIFSKVLGPKIVNCAFFMHLAPTLLYYVEFVHCRDEGCIKLYIPDKQEISRCDGNLKGIYSTTYIFQGVIFKMCF